MLKEKESVLQKVAIVLDALLIVLAFLAAFFLRQQFHTFYRFNIIPSSLMVPETTASLSDYLVVLFLVVPTWCLILQMNGMYRSMRTRQLHEIVWIILKSMFFMILVFGAFVFLFKFWHVSRLFFIFFIILVFVFIFLEKVIIFVTMHYLRRRGYGLRSLLVVGTGNRADNIITKLKDHPEWGFQVLGAIDDEPGRGVERVGDMEIIGAIDDLPDILHRQAVDEVIFVVPRSRLNFIENSVYVCETEGVKATVAVDLFDLKIAQSKPSEIENIPLISFETTVAKEWELFIKRTLDFILSGLGIIVLSPFLLIGAALIKLTSPGPVFYKQERLGLNGRRFVLYKFRTMHVGSDNDLAEVNVNHEMDDPEFKKKKIQHITGVGRFMRKFSIDELPQLFNVFVGHMSLVGPRPCVPEEVEQYKPWQRRRMSMRPGITCLWQVGGRNKISFEDWMKLDLEYLDNWSLWLDFKILAKTIPVVIFGIGAY